MLGRNLRVSRLFFTGSWERSCCSLRSCVLVHKLILLLTAVWIQCNRAWCESALMRLFTLVISPLSSLRNVCLSICLFSSSVLKRKWKSLRCVSLYYFGPQVYRMGSLVIAHVSPSVGFSVRPLQFSSKTALGMFLTFCMNVRYHKYRKVSEPIF